MCGIAGFGTAPVHRAAITGRAPRQPWRRRCAPRARRRRRVDRSGGRRGARRTAASRSSTCRRPAISRWPPRAAALSSPTMARSTTTPTARRARRVGAHLSRPLGHRGPGRGAARLGGRGDAAQAHRHVRLRGLGPARRARLTLARDRFGIKPLYWGRCGDAVPVRLRAQGAARPPAAGRRRSIATRSPPICGAATCRRRSRIYRGLHKLMPGHFLVLPRRPASPASGSYWDPGAGRRGGAGRRRDARTSGGPRPRSRALLERRRRPPDDRRRAARRLPLRRHRLLACRRADAGAQPAGR